MCKKNLRQALRAVAIAMLAVISTNGQTTNNSNEPVAFDASSLIQTIEELSRATELDILETPLQNVVDLIQQQHKLKFQIVATEPVSVTIKTSGKLGDVLVRMLAKIDCEYMILPNGRIVIRDTNKQRTIAKEQ